MVDKAEDRERTIPTATAHSKAEPVDMMTTRDTAIAARETVHAEYVRFRKLLREAGLDKPEPVSIAEAAEAIASGGALIMPVIPSRGDGYALILAAGVRRPEVLPLAGLTEAWLGAQLGIWFEGYTAFLGSVGEPREVWNIAVAAWNRTMASVLLEVGAKLIGPVDRCLRETMRLQTGTAEVILMLPGRLSALPLHAAPVNDDGGILLDHWVVRQVANTRVLLTTHLANQRDSKPATLLGITDPQDNIGILHNPAADPGWFPVGGCMDLIKADATVDVVKTLLPRHSHVCFYCHGDWDPQTPELSGLEMADGTLTVMEAP